MEEDLQRLVVVIQETYQFLTRERLSWPISIANLRHLFSDDLFLTVQADHLARETGFVQRQSPITGAALAQMLVFGFLNTPEASYSDLQQTLGLQGIHVTNQAIEERMTPQAATFLHRLCEAVVGMALTGEPTQLPVFKRFNGIYAASMAPSSAYLMTWKRCGLAVEAALRREAKLGCKCNCVWISRMDTCRDPGWPKPGKASERSPVPLTARSCLLAKELDERTRRLGAASEANLRGRGGIAIVSRATGVLRKAISLGIKQLQQETSMSPGSRRRAGGGRKKTVTKDLSLS